MWVYRNSKAQIKMGTVTDTLQLDKQWQNQKTKQGRNDH